MEQVIQNVAAVDSTIDKEVDNLLKQLTGLTAKFNRDSGLSVIDLVHRQESQGVRFRQVFVSRNNGAINVSLVETFKSTFGGTETKKTLGVFTVSVSDISAYSKLERRFFNYSGDKNVSDAKYLLQQLTAVMT
jgi:hypothetical protein